MKLSLGFGAALLLLCAQVHALPALAEPPADEIALEGSRLQEEIASLLATEDKAPVLTLPDSIRLAVQVNHGIESVRSQLRSFELQNRASKVGGVVTAAAGFSHGTLYETSNPGSVVAGYGPYSNTFNYGYGLSLQNFLQGWLRGDQLEHQAKSALNLAQAENLLALAVAQSYMQLVASLSHLRDYGAILKAYVGLEQMAGGPQNRAFSDLIHGDLQRLEGKVTDVANLRAQALQSLKGLLQEPLHDGNRFQFNFTPADKVAVTIPASEDETAQELLKNGPQLELLREALYAAKSTRSADRAALLPDVSYNQRWANTASVTGGIGFHEGLRADTLAVSVPINPGQWVRAHADTVLVHAREENIEQKKIDLLSDIRSLWQQADNHKKSFDIQSRNYQVAQTGYICATAYYPTIGQPADPRVVHDGLNNMLTALDGLYDAGVQWVNSKAEIRNALGTLTDITETEKAVPAEVQPETTNLAQLCGGKS